MRRVNGRTWPEDKDKFADLTIKRGAFSGSALIHGARAGIDCRLHAVHPERDHGIFVGHFEQILLADAPEDGITSLCRWAVSALCRMNSECINS